jgi:hypothetical protein
LGGTMRSGIYGFGSSRDHSDLASAGTSPLSHRTRDPLGICDVSKHKSVTIFLHRRRSSFIHISKSAVLKLALWWRCTANNGSRIRILLCQYYCLDGPSMLLDAIATHSTGCVLRGDWLL